MFLPVSAAIWVNAAFLEVPSFLSASTRSKVSRPTEPSRLLFGGASTLVERDDWLAFDPALRARFFVVEAPDASGARAGVVSAKLEVMSMAGISKTGSFAAVR